ncbi:MaoC/PaaZ C-terminal domain-containing protein [Pigmentiphaga soli]|uniref:MaoC/PaaZ C-terminal domain-containing protein n=1 Tax=Pigmentiphaga soli TaxID=1007095 RepID=A0ABP8GX34_9BURK
MPLDYDKLKDWRAEGPSQTYDADDTILYALGIGLGHDPTDPRQLRFVYEKDLKALPTLCTVLAHPFAWLHKADPGINRTRLVHAEQGIRLHRPLPVAGQVHSETRVTGIVDKGPDKGALVYSERRLYDSGSGDLLASLTATTMCRADGGFGGPAGPIPPAPAVPQREPDHRCDLPVLPQAALLYRLNGDRNPLHADPEVARRAGFDRPILHGMCSFGMAGHALLRTLCDYDPARLVSLSARFSAPVYPGETLTIEMWRESGAVAFRGRVAQRDAIVLNHGQAQII